MSTATAASTARFASGGRALVTGLLLSVTLVAFEATAVVTVMPTITADLSGDALYGAAFSAFMLANLVSAVVAAELADNRGPAASFLLGIVAFGAGLAVAGLAPTMAILILGRILQGIGAGGLTASAYVAIGRGFPAERQPKLFALLSTGWVLPSLIAPAAAGSVAEHWGWRWVFLGLGPLVVLVAVLALPALVAIPGVRGLERRPSRVPAALVLAGGSGLLIAGLQTEIRPLQVVLSFGGAAIALPALRRLLPVGTATARPGLPAAVACRFLVNAAFFGADTFLPLAASRIHGASSTTAGLVIIGGALSWTVGATLSARRQLGTAARKVAMGFAFLAVGIAGVTPIVWAWFPLWAVFLLWSLGGLGIGIVFNTTSVAAMADAPSGREGMVASQLQIVDSLGFALASGIGGALVSLADQDVLGLSAALAVVFLGAAAVAAIGVVAGRGVRVPAEAPARA